MVIQKISCLTEYEERRSVVASSFSLADMAKVRGSPSSRFTTHPSATPFDPLPPTRVAFRQRGEGEQLFAHHQQVTPGQQIPQGPSQHPADGGIHNAATNWLRDPVIVSTR